jgi:hypothetical protein
MTFTQSKTKKGYSYLLLDDFVKKLEIYSINELSISDVDIIILKILEIGSEKGIIETEKGNVTYTLIHKKWENIKNTNKKKND